MKTNKKFLIGTFISLILTTYGLSAQSDYTYLITNPSFETGDYAGWTWTGRTGGWITVNTDGDGSKNGTYIAGYWNASIGDCDCSQKVTGLPPGIYKLTALASVSHERVTNQRLFANNKSMLYGESTNPAYTPSNLAILANTESYSFAGHPSVSTENGPFKKLSIVQQITDGSLNFGFRFSGKATALGYNFSNSTKGDAGFFKFDNFTLTEVSKTATLENIRLSTGALNELFIPDSLTYSVIFPVGITNVTPTAVPSVDGQIITGTDVVDLTSGNGQSKIKVVSIDGTTSKTYTINYSVLSTSKETIKSFSYDTSAVTFQLAYGKMKVQVCTDKIIRVSYTSSENIPSSDTIIVNRNWFKCEFTVTEDESTIYICTNSLDIKVSKTNSLIRFFDKSGTLITSEFNKSLTAKNIFGALTNNCSVTFNSPTSEGLYGLGQHQQRIMNYKGKTVTLDQQNTEIALPFLVSTTGYGILWDNYSITNFYGNLSSNTQYQFNSESGKMVDYYFMYGPELDDVISDYRFASGAAPMFPKWAYGLFQSKDKYTSTTELLGIANQYRSLNIPLDCIVQDWDYWTPDYWGSNTMDATRYPNPKALIDSLHRMNIHTMISIWPVFHANTSNYQEYSKINALYPSTGAHHFYDPHNSAAQKIYWKQVNTQLFSKYGWDAWWADNDEPQGYPDGIDRMSFLTAKGPGVTYYNTYPIQHTSEVYSGWRKDIPNKRVFTLSRSAFPGQQRYATAAWSGDISSNWNDFQNQLSAGLNFCLSGIPYWTTDIGGYGGADWTTIENQELMIRWFQYGAFCPIFRIHGKGDKAIISSTFNQSTKNNMISTDRLRYRLMPYIYSTAWKVTNENYTMMRHLVMDYRKDENVKNIDNQFMFGPSIMVNPVVAAGVLQRSVYLPEGKWYDFWTGKQLSGGQTITADAPLIRIPLFVKAGAIIPIGPEVVHANELVDPIEIRVYQGKDGSFVLYEDEGDTYNYEKGHYAEIPLSYSDNAKQLTIGARNGSFSNMLTNRVFKIVFVDANYGVGITDPMVYDSIVHYNGSKVVVNLNTDLVIPDPDSTVSVYESFDYPLNSNLNGLGAVGKGWGSPWTVYEGSLADMSIKAAIPYSGINTKGGKMVGNLSSATGLRAYRELNPEWTDDGSDIWFSFLLELGNPSSLINTWQGLSLFKDSQERILFGKNWGKSQLGIIGYDASEGLSTTPALGLQPTWIVALIRTSGNALNETAYMWINPDPNNEPQISTADVSTSVNLNSGFNRVTCHLGMTAGVSAGFDEIHIGKTFGNVSNPLISGINKSDLDDNFRIITNSVARTSTIYYNCSENGVGRLLMRDLNGRCVLDRAIKHKIGQNIAAIHFGESRLKTGIYFVSLLSKELNYTDKIVVQ